MLVNTKKMKFIVAPDSYKESLSAYDVSVAMEQGIRNVFPKAEVIKLPIADGGEGTTAVIYDTCGGEIITKMVTAADGTPKEASYLLLEDKAIIEVADASGLEHIKREQRNPFTATSYGTGELMLDALERGVRSFIIGLGGSACNDAGAGLLQALGIELLDDTSQPIVFGNAPLGTVKTILYDNFLEKYPNIEILIASDVTNVLYGKKGASFTFGKQKGAKSEDELKELDKNIKSFAKVVEAAKEKSYHDLPGSGAAGGVGFALATLTDNLKIESGIEVVLDLLNFDEHLPETALILTGEGATDFQTAYGKAPMGVAKRGLLQEVPTIIISGKVEGDLTALYNGGIVAAFSVLHTISTLEEAMSDAAENIAYTTEAIIRTRF